SRALALPGAGTAPRAAPHTRARRGGRRSVARAPAGDDLRPAGSGDGRRVAGVERTGPHADSPRRARLRVGADVLSRERPVGSRGPEARVVRRTARESVPER